MFVRKFEADTIDEAIKAIKRELGPDAIILKTITHKGLMAQMKKKRVEVTAAITEEEYEKKIRAEKSLNDDQKEKFYQLSSTDIKHSLKSFESVQKNQRQVNSSNFQSGDSIDLESYLSDSSQNDQGQTQLKSRPISPSGYGKAALNKSTVSFNPTLDDKTLSASNIGGGELDDSYYLKSIAENRDGYLKTQAHQESSNHDNQQLSKQKFDETNQGQVSQKTHYSYEEIDRLQNRQIELEKKIIWLSEKLDNYQLELPIGLNQFKDTFVAFGVNQNVIHKMISEMQRELDPSSFNHPDVVMDYAYNFILKSWNVYFTRDKIISKQKQSELGSKSQSLRIPKITFLISEASCGQSHLALKVANLEKNSQLIIMDETNHDTDLSKRFACHFLNIHPVVVRNVPELVGECRKALQNKMNIVVDYKDRNYDQVQIKKFCQGIHRSFESVQFYLTLSVLHSEKYNRFTLQRYSPFIHGINWTHLDVGINTPSIFNLAFSYSHVPIVYLSQDEKLPHGIYVATPKILLTKVFQIESDETIFKEMQDDFDLTQKKIENEQINEDKYIQPKKFENSFMYSN